jgi:3-oxoacyl-[acyl-carrier-protein] synthase II
MDRVGQLSVACCRLALEDSSLIGDPAFDGGTVGVALGTATAGLHTLVSYLDRLQTLGATGASALDFSNTVGNAAASLCALEFHLRGINVTVAQKEGAGLAAIAHAANALRMGRVRAMVTGAVDDFEEIFFKVHDRFHALATDEGAGEASRPFDRRRNGFVLGSGAFLLVIEPVAVAAARGAVPMAGLAGWAATSTPCRLHEWPADPSQLVRCMREALERASIPANGVGVVFASANSSRQLDRVEAEALTTVFGPYRVPVAAVKGALGECSATSAAGVVAAVLSLKRRMVPPTVGFEQPDPTCRVDVSGKPRPMREGAPLVALVNSFASGGANFSVVVTA